MHAPPASTQLQLAGTDPPAATWGRTAHFMAHTAGHKRRQPLPTCPHTLPRPPALLGSARHHAADEDQDEFAEHFRRVRPPNVLITTSYKVTGVMYKFVSELLEVSVRPPGVCGGVGVACENSGCG